VSALVLDAGAFIAAERGDRQQLARLSAAHAHGLDLRTCATVVAQVWRDARRQAMLSRLLRAVAVIELTESAARAAGELLARTATADVIDATVIGVAATGDRVVTSDPVDLRRLAHASGRKIRIVGC
jgi:predicted nucleic acid-binding protein